MIRALAAALAFVCAAPAYAQPCRPVADVQAQLAPILAPIDGKVVILMGNEAKLYLDVLNSTPPETHLAGDGVLLAVAPKYQVMVGIIQGGNACPVGTIALSVHERAMASVEEHRS